MYGAILGDVIGSRFEFDCGGKTKEFELFTKEDCFTDDTVMTIAVCEGLLKAGKDANVEKIHKCVIESMKKWGHRYPNAGYGYSFYNWLFYQTNPKPYGSYGNGSAMRVSSAGWLYDSLERTREVARATAEVTHNHPEGIKGAECTAAVIYLSRTGSNKETIKEYVIKEFGYDLHESVEELRLRHEHIETCQDSLPKALTSFFEGTSYEDVVRNAISLGGDTDTLSAIAGSMAEAYYGIPIGILVDGKDYFEEDIFEIINLFDKARNRQKDEYKENYIIKEAIERAYSQQSDDSRLSVIRALLERMFEDGQVPVAMVDKNHVMDSLDLNHLCCGDSFHIDHELRLTIDLVEDKKGCKWVPLYTDNEEIDKGVTTNIRMNLLISDIMENGLADDVEGIVINPFGYSFEIPKEALKMIKKASKKYEI